VFPRFLQMEVELIKEERPIKEKSTTASPGFWKGGFIEFFREGQFSDITIVDPDNKKEYKAHKFILVRKSAYFRKLFLGGFREESLPIIELKDTNSLDAILHYLYTGEIHVAPDNVASLLDGAEMYAIEGLTRFILDIVQSQLDTDKDLIFIYFNRGHESRLACTEYIRDNFSELVENGCFERVGVDMLPPLVLYEILSSDMLNTKREDDVCKAAQSYITNNLKNLSTENQIKILSTPRYQYTKTETLLNMHVQFRNILPPEFQDVLLLKMCQQGDIKVPSELIKPNPRTSYGMFMCLPKSLNDCQGLFYWLGKNKGLEAWQNPVSKGYIAISCSSSWGGGPPDTSLCALGGNQPHVFFWTNNEPNGWISFDINPNNKNMIKFIPTHYVYGFQTNMWLPRNWNFEGSVDGNVWDVLKAHVNDQTIMNATVFTFEVNNVVQGYRYFRMRVTGPDSSATNYLGLSGFEMFGKVIHS